VEHADQAGCETHNAAEGAGVGEPSDLFPGYDEYEQPEAREGDAIHEAPACSTRRYPSTATSSENGLQAPSAALPLGWSSAPRIALAMPGASPTAASRPSLPPRRISQGPLSQFVATRSEEHTSELQSRFDLVCRLLLEK